VHDAGRTLPGFSAGVLRARSKKRREHLLKAAAQVLLEFPICFSMDMSQIRPSFLVGPKENYATYTHDRGYLRCVGHPRL
jgi:hypothetical protein